MVIKRAILLAVVVIFFWAIPSHAASGSITVIPQEGDFLNGEKFQAQIKIDGGGTRFNAAKANVSVSENLRVEGVTLGDCGFAYVDTPSLSSLSFAGVILGNSSQSCTAYTLSLRVTGANNGFVFISDGSIKSYDGAKEILEKIQNSSYSFPSSSVQEESVITPTQQPLVSSNGQRMYTLVYSISSDKVSDVKNLDVILDQNLPTQMAGQLVQSPTDSTVYFAIFDNVVEGVHTVDVLAGSEKLSSEIVNVEGDSREISLGVSPRHEAVSMLVWMLLAVGLIVVVSAIILGYLFYRRKILHSS